jgi:GntR family transcriptional regulator/MocR family aminotransferase
MPKRVTAFELLLPPRRPGTAVYQWVYTALRTGILEGRLRPGRRLPASRDLAIRYGLSRGTIVTAFEQLKSEGYIEGSVGSGTFVSKVLPDQLLQVSQKRGAKTASLRKPQRALSSYGRQLNLFPAFEARPSRAFRSNLPALDLFPATLWAQIAARRLRRVSTNLLLGCDSMGFQPLRAAIADYLMTSRGVNCVPEQVAIVSGVQEAIDLTARLFLNPGDRVCMENPGYIGATYVFEAAGARISPARLDSEGIILNDRNLRGSRLVYVTPGHQFPLGITMSLSRRLQLLKWAQTSGALVFEDDYDSEYRYSGRPVAALQGLDSTGQVLYAGSFSKTLFPSLRLGYLVIPPDLIPSFAAAKSLTNRHAPLLEQTVLCDFINDGHFGRHLRRMREIYSERLTTLLETSRQRLTGLLEISDVEAGLQTVGWLCDGLNSESVTKTAAARGVEVIPLNWYELGRPTHQGLQLGFAAVRISEINRGVRELAIALEAERRANRL